MSVVLTYESKVTALETVETETPLADDANSIITHDGLDTSDTLNAGTGVPVTKVVANTITMTAGAATIDMTALVGSNGGAVDMTGLKLQIFKLKAKATNTNPLVVKFGAADPYTGLGSAFNFELQPGAEMTFFGNEKSAEVASGVKDLDVAGTASEEVDMMMVCG